MSTRSKSGRILRPTERGRSYNLELNQAERANLNDYLQQLIQETREIVDCGDAPSQTDWNHVKSRSDQIDLVYERFMSSQAKCVDLTLPEDRDEEEAFTKKVSQDVEDHQTKCKGWLKDHQPTPPAQARSEAASRGSSRRTGRTTSSRASSRLSEKLAQERVRAEVEKSFKASLQQKQMELEEMQTSMEMAKTEAKVQAYERELQETEEIDMQIDEALVNVPKFERNTYTQSFIQSLPDPQATNILTGSPADGVLTTTTPTIEKLSESIHKTINKLDRLQPATTLGYAPFTLTSIMQSSARTTSTTTNQVSMLNRQTNASTWNPATTSLLNPPVLSQPTNNSTWIKPDLTPMFQPSLLINTSVRPLIHSTIVTSSNIPTATQSNDPVPAKRTNHEEPRQMTAMFRELQAPTVLLDPFNGNPMDFPFFMTNFE